MSLRIFLALPFIALWCLEVQAAAWPEPSTVIVNNIALNKKLAPCKDCYFRGLVRSIQQGNFDNEEGDEIAVVPQTGLFYLELNNLTLKRNLTFQKTQEEPIWFGIAPSIVPLPDNKYAIAMGGGGYGETALLNSEGKMLWKFSDGMMNPRKMLHADLDGDSKEEFYVNGNKGIYRLDLEGKSTWLYPGKYGDIALIRGTGGKGIVVGLQDESGMFSRSSKFQLLDTNGKSIGEIPFKGKEIFNITSISTANNSGIIGLFYNTISYFDAAGKLKFEYTFKDLPVYHGPYATFVRFESNTAPYIAILLLSRSAKGRSALSIFNQEGKLLYQEVLAGGSGMLAIQKNTDGQESLLVGDGLQKLWVYDLNSKKTH